MGFLKENVEKNWFQRNISGYKTGMRIVFGLVWLLDAYLKWQPDFFSGFETMLQGAASGQPAWILPWFTFWISVTSTDPYAFALFIALVETLLALAIIFGFMRKVTYLLGAAFSFFLWSIPEGFGGFYLPGSTDIGTSVIYVLVFLFLILVNGAFGPSRYSLDFYIEKKFKAWKRIAEISWKG